MDDTSSSIIPYLFMLTFVLVLIIAIWQYRKVKKAKREHHQSAQARAHGDRPKEAARSDEPHPNQSQ